MSKKILIFLIFIIAPVLTGLYLQVRFLSGSPSQNNQTRNISQTTPVEPLKQEEKQEIENKIFKNELLDIPDTSDVSNDTLAKVEQLINSFIPASQSPQVSSQKKQPASSQFQTFLVTRVIDGDTIEIEGGEKVRYIGIDTPETVDPRKPVQFFGKEAAEKNHHLVEGKRVGLQKDISETDKYGRLLRYVWLGESMINLVLVKEGYARVSTYPPDVKYQALFIDAEREAREKGLGLWGNSIPANQNQCLIKGNISSSGEKIYHLPGGEYYDKTVIDESKGERWFCTEEEAQVAGWRKSKL